MEKFIKGYKDVMTYIGILGLIGFIVSVMIQVIARTFLPVSYTHLDVYKRQRHSFSPPLRRRA